MATALKLGPTDRGRPMDLDDFMAADYEEGFRYELIDGKLSVSPQPNLPEGLNEDWLYQHLRDYARQHPEVINWVYNKARVFVPGRRGVTNPEPDIAAYCDFPLQADFRAIRWEDVSPILVAEILSADDPAKDLVRNVELYLQVPSIKEYWLLDPRADPERPTLRVHRRHGKKWRVLDLACGDLYTTRLLPEFRLLVDPRRS